MANRKDHPLDPEDPNLDIEKQQVREMTQRYKNVFGSEEGRLVLGDILTLCHFGETLDPDNLVQVSEYNVGLVIITNSGMLDSIYSQLGMGR